MKDFADFEEYFAGHIQEAAYDALDTLRAKENEINLSAEDVEFVVLAARHGALSVLRQYHNWLKHMLS